MPVDPRVSQTLRRMLAQRGHTLDERLAEEAREAAGALRGCAVARDDLHLAAPGVLVFCNESRKTGLPCVRAYVALARRLGVARVIVVAQHGCTSFAQNYLSAPPPPAADEDERDVSPSGRAEPDVVCELFQAAELVFDITEHDLYVPHVPVTGDARAKVLRRFAAEHLPVILTTDPVVRYFAFAEATVLAIERHCGDQGRTVYYRIVRDGGDK